ncbi:MAG: hypothetical protein ACXV3S_01595, partial [Kineosporiaceae bacterium]
LLAIGTVLLVGYAPLQDWPLYPLITPLVMGLGAGLILYGSRASSRRVAQTFHYRYRGLHLLIQGKDRLFLVPGAWSPSDFTLVLPTDGSARLQFQFENSPP